MLHTIALVIHVMQDLYTIASRTTKYKNAFLDTYEQF